MAWANFALNESRRRLPTMTAMLIWLMGSPLIGTCLYLVRSGQRRASGQALPMVQGIADTCQRRGGRTSGQVGPSTRRAAADIRLDRIQRTNPLRCVVRRAGGDAAPVNCG